MPSNAQRNSGQIIAEPAYAASTCSHTPLRSQASAIRATGSTEVLEVVPTVATTCARVGQVERVGPETERVVGRHLPELELEHAARLVDGGVRMLRADDDPRTGLRLTGGRERRERRERRSLLEMAVPAGGQPDQLGEPGDDRLLELLQRRRRAPENADVVERGGEQLGEDARSGAGGREVGEEAWTLPVRDARA